MFRSRLLFAALRLALAPLVAFSFEIAIYHDPLSERIDLFLKNCRYGFWSGTRAGDSLDIFTHYYSRAMMDSVYKWYRAMGVTKVMVNYPYLSNFDEIPVDTNAGIKVMNWNYSEA